MCMCKMSYLPTPLIMPIDTRTALITAWEVRREGCGKGGGVEGRCVVWCVGGEEMVWGVKGVGGEGERVEKWRSNERH